MTLRELYELAGGSYDGMMDRMITEARIEKFVRMFPDDPSYENLRVALEKRAPGEAFAAAHTFKGVCLSLGFTRLYEAACDVTEALRTEDLAGAEGLMPRLETEYGKIRRAIENN